LSYSQLYANYIYITPQPNSSGEIYGHCPFHNDRNKSFSFNDNTGLWYCFRCELGGTPEYFVAKMEEISMAEAQRKVQQVLGEDTLPSNQLITEWEDNLRDSPSVQAYLKRRGLTEEEVWYENELGWDGERLTIPIRNKEGELLNVRRYSVSGEDPKVLNWPGFGQCEVWPIEQLEYSDQILLCAGEMDTLSAIEQGYPAVTGTGGENVWRQSLSTLFSGKDVYIVYDGDDIGERSAQDRAIDLSDYAKSVYITHLPKGKDVNDLHKEGEDLQEYLDRAILIGTPGARVVDGEELLREAELEAQMPWIVDTLIRPGWLGVLGGHGKAGKTTLSMHLFEALNKAEEFLCYEVDEPVPTLYVSYEMSTPDLLKMYSEIISQNPDLWPKTVLDPPKPLEPDDLKPFLGTEPGLAVIDSATPAFGLRGEAENQSGEVGHYLRGIQTLARRTGWTFIIIHHLKKSADGSIMDLAGSREWFAAPDALMIWSNDNEKQDKPGELVVDGRLPPRDPLKIQLKWDNLKYLGEKPDVEESETEKEVVKLLKDNPGQTLKAIMKELDRPRTTIWSVLTEGDFHRLGTGKKGDPYRWYHVSNLPKEGRDY